MQYSRVEGYPDAMVAGSRLPLENTAIVEGNAALLAKIEELEKRVALLGKGGSEKKCFNCGRTGHIKDDCFRKGGGKEGQYPAWWRGQKDTAISVPSSVNPTMVPVNANVAVGKIPQYYALVSMAGADLSRSIYADTGATDHFF